MKFTPLIQKALNTAARLHKGQVRKGIKYPYIVHPVGVAMILSEYTDDENTIAAGLLHDILEDVKKYGKEKMLKDFGPKITQIVSEVSEDKDPNIEEDLVKTWETRKKGYLKNLKHDSQPALMISAADKIHNLLSQQEAYEQLGQKAFKDFNAPISKNIQNYKDILGVLKERLDNPIVAELEMVLLTTQKLLAKEIKII